MGVTDAASQAALERRNRRTGTVLVLTLAALYVLAIVGVVVLN